MGMATFEGRRESGVCRVMVYGRGPATHLNPRRDLRNHSPDGFNWGYGGSGPAQLALALLSAVVGDFFGQALYQEFKAEVIAALMDDSWQITETEILDWWERKAAIPDVQRRLRAAREEQRQ